MLIALLASLLLAPGLQEEDDKGGIQAGAWEVGIETSLFFQGGESESFRWSMEGAIGYFLTDHWALGLTAQVGYEKEEIGARSEAEFTGTVRYHFQPDERWVPFVGLQAGVRFDDPREGPSEISFLFGPEVGFHWFLNKARDLSLNVTYELGFVASTLGNPSHELSIGFSRFF
jgi:hypothetical protein